MPLRRGPTVGSVARENFVEWPEVRLVGTAGIEDNAGEMEFAGFAARFVGEGAGRESFLVALPGLPRVEVAATYSSGVFMGATLIATAPGLKGAPEIVLRREFGSDHRAKWIGLAREVQTGDPGFDRRVFLDTEAGAGGRARTRSWP